MTVKTLASVVGKPIFKYSMRSIVTAFYREASGHLNPEGTLYVNTLSPDLGWLSDVIAGRARVTECRRSREYCIVKIAPIAGEAPPAPR